MKKKREEAIKKYHLDPNLIEGLADKPGSGARRRVNKPEVEGNGGIIIDNWEESTHDDKNEILRF